MTGMDIVKKAKSYKGKYAKHNNKFTKHFAGKYHVKKNGYYSAGYCTLFVMYVYDKLGILSWFPKKSDNTNTIYKYLKSKGKIITDPKKAKAGMPAFKKCGSTKKKSSGHTSIFWKYENGYVYTVDGNVNGGVIVRKKKPEWYLGFGNILKTTAKTTTKTTTAKAFALKHLPIRIDKISQPYKAGKHRGIDLVDNRGVNAPIYAVADGTVVCAGGKGHNWDWSYGNEVAIDHGNGYFTNYGHLSRINVKVNQKVKASDVLGTQGSSGNSTGNHLHFEVWNTGGQKRDFNKHRVDPKPYIDAYNRPSYTVGKEYTVFLEDMNVRESYGTKYAKVGVKKKGTKVVVKAVKKTSGTTCWIKIGDKQWICGYSGSKVYIK